MRTIGKLVLLLAVLAVVFPAGADTIDLNCTTPDAPATLEAALAMASPGDTINITGPCPGTAVTITTDDLAIVGVQDAILEGVGPDEPVVEILGARRVSIEGVTVKGGEDGLAAIAGAIVGLSGVVAQGNADDGIAIATTSVALIEDCTAQDNGDDGFLVVLSASALFLGEITSTGNGDDGISVILSASSEFLEAMVTATNNGQIQTFDGFIIGDGIRVTDAASLLVLGSTVEVSGNANDGIALDRSSSFGAFGSAEGDPTSITVTGNGELSGTVGAGGDGIQVTGQSAFSAVGSNVSLTVTGNARRAFNVMDSTLNLFNAVVVCEEIPEENTCPTSS